MTAPSEGELRNDDLANRAVPHMSQTQHWTPIRGQFCAPVDNLRDLTRKSSRGEFSLGPMLMALLRTAGLEVRRVS